MYYKKGKLRKALETLQNGYIDFRFWIAPRLGLNGAGWYCWSNRPENITGPYETVYIAKQALPSGFAVAEGRSSIEWRWRIPEEMRKPDRRKRSTRSVIAKALRIHAAGWYVWINNKATIYGPYSTPDRAAQELQKGKRGNVKWYWRKPAALR